MIDITIKDLLQKHPYVTDFFELNGLDVEGKQDLTFRQFLASLSAAHIEDFAIDTENLSLALTAYVEEMSDFLGLKEDKTAAVRSLTVIAGHDKSGKQEDFGSLEIQTSQIISIVGPTGSGKSRLLADIEWTAQADTPTGRSILINGEKPDAKWRFSSNNKLVAQLSQNMNFVMDLSAGEFVELHAASRLVPDTATIASKVIEAANELAGERFGWDTPITSLSGGQSRALMIADTAILSSAPIVLIDEIENAGVDRRKALDLLVAKDKIVLIATHDPLLALMADRRIVIKNGGIHAVIDTTEEEKSILTELDKLDEIIRSARTKLRAGDSLTVADLGQN